MRVRAIASDVQSLITQIRVAVPLRAALSGRGDSFQFESYPFVSLADLAQTDVLVAQRGCTRRHVRLMLASRALGGAVICEIDDLLTEPAPHLAYYQSIERSRKWVQQCLAAAHVVTTSTPRLAAALAPYADHVEVVPNYAHALAHLPLPQPQPGEPCTVLLAASDSLAATSLYPALRHLAQTRGPAFQIVGVGRAGEDAAAAGLTVQRHPLLPRDRFLMLARDLPNVVAVIPLDDSRFSACKSAVKWFDYAEAGVPTVTSNLPPYADVIEHGRTGLLVDDHQQAWQDALSQALDDTAWRAQVAQAAREQVRAHHHLGISVQAWERALQKAVALRDSDPVPQSWWGDWRNRVAGPIDSTIVGLRRANRRRLDLRRVRKEV